MPLSIAPSPIYISLLIAALFFCAFLLTVKKDESEEEEKKDSDHQDSQEFPPGIYLPKEALNKTVFEAEVESEDEDDPESGEEGVSVHVID